MKTVLPIIPLSAALLVLSLAASKPRRADSDKHVEHIEIAEGQILYEVIGQAISSPTGGTLFGYYPYIQGLETLFGNAPEDETTALFTFFRDTTNLRVAANGPLRILSREGTVMQPKPCPPAIQPPLNAAGCVPASRVRWRAWRASSPR